MFNGPNRTSIKSRKVIRDRDHQFKLVSEYVQEEIVDESILYHKIDQLRLRISTMTAEISKLETELLDHEAYLLRLQEAKTPEILNNSGPIEILDKGEIKGYDK